MLQPSSEANLAQEPLGTERGGELRTQQLERDGPIVPQIIGTIHDGHSTAPDLPVEAVATGQVGRETGQAVGQRGRLAKGLPRI